MNDHHVCVWIDHVEARIFGLRRDDTDVRVLEAEGPRHRIHRKANHVGLGTERVDPQLLDAVEEQLSAARGIMLCGPGEARHELAAHLDRRRPPKDQRVWPNVQMDHPSDAQIAAFARKFFMDPIRRAR